ncbi:MAG: xylulokinase, partial [Candidatus Aminicenantes bacterium]|nr:xylulokinase [Candidatus Aminicenantes bacterium]
MHAVGIDSGTQGTKALVVDAESGRVVGRGAAPHAMIAGLPPGASEQDPAVWLTALEAALRAALKDAKASPAAVVSLGVSGQQHGFVPLDADGRPLRPAKLWNDTSTVAETEELRAKLGGHDAYREKLGISLAVGFTASKILWLKKNEPERFRRLARVLLPHDFLNFVLTGVARMEYGDASGTGLMDVRNRRWHPEAVAAVDPRLADALPEIAHPSLPLGYLKPEIASRFGFKKVLVSSGGGDNMMGAIGTGNVSTGVCTLSLGTSGTIYSYSAEPFSDPRGEIAVFCDSTGGWLPLLCTMNVTNATELYKSLLGGISNEELERLAADAPAGASGLVFLPFVDGERVPALPDASAAFIGLNRAAFGRSPMARAVLEGAILNLGYGFGRLKELGLRPAEIRATGGGAKSRLWLQIVADVFRTPVVTLQEQEAAAFGAALQSIWAWRREKGEDVSIPGLAERMVVKGRDSFLPDPGRSELYRETQDRFNALWRRLAPVFERP